MPCGGEVIIQAEIAGAIAGLAEIKLFVGRKAVYKNFPMFREWHIQGVGFGLENLLKQMFYKQAQVGRIPRVQEQLRLHIGRVSHIAAVTAGLKALFTSGAVFPPVIDAILQQDRGALA